MWWLTYTSTRDGVITAPLRLIVGKRTKYGSSEKSRDTVTPPSCTVPPRAPEDAIASTAAQRFIRPRTPNVIAVSPRRKAPVELAKPVEVKSAAPAESPP